jgi:outer membrane protein assembly factor BamB
MALLLLAADPPFTVQTPAPDWTQFRLTRGNEARVPGTLEVNWTIHTGGGFSSSPIVRGETLYVGNNAGEFFALDARTGAIAWTNRFASSLMAAPILYRDNLIVGEGDQMGCMTSDHVMNVGRSVNALVALDPQTGAERWRYTLAGTGMPTSAVVSGTLVQHDGAGNVTGIDPSTGRQRFVRNVGGFASMSAILPIGGDRFVTTGYRTSAMWAMHAGDGSIVWEHDFSVHSSGVGDCPPAGDGVRAFCNYLMPAGRETDINVGKPAQMHAYAIAVGNGASVWDVGLETGIVPMWNEAAIPLAWHGAVYMGSSVAPYMHALDALSGRLMWRVRVHGPVKGGIVAADGLLYFGDLGGYLWAVNPADGHVVGVKNMHVPFNVGSPVVYGQTLFIGGHDGTLLAVPLAAIRSGKDP